MPDLPDDRCIWTEDCDHEPFCQVGMPPRTVCHCHFEDYLREAAEVIRALVAHLTIPPQPVVVVHGNGHKERG